MCACKCGVSQSIPLRSVLCIEYVCACKSGVSQSIPLRSVYVLSMCVHVSVVCRNPYH